jgi:hypothetical protein
MCVHMGVYAIRQLHDCLFTKASPLIVFADTKQLQVADYVRCYEHCSEYHSLDDFTCTIFANHTVHIRYITHDNSECFAVKSIEERDNFFPDEWCFTCLLVGSSNQPPVLCKIN